MKKLFLVLLCSLGAMAGFINNTTDENGFPLILPQPQKIIQTRVSLSIPRKFTLTAPEQLTCDPLKRVLDAKKIPLVKSNKGFCKFVLLDKQKTMPPEGYQLSISGQGILVEAEQMSGLYNGLQTLCWILRNTHGTKLKGCHIEDYPELALRAIYLELNYTAPIEMDRMERVFQVFSALKYNTIIVDFGDKFPIYGKNLEKARSPFSVEDVQHFMKIAEKNHLEIIPLVQCISHAWWLARHPDFFTKFSEKPKPTGDLYGGTWGAMYCPCCDEAKKIAVDYVKSHLELLKPRYFHIAMDELYPVPKPTVCERCKKLGYKKQIADHAKELCDMIFAHGATPIFYDDQFRVDAWPHGPLVELLDGFDKRVIFNVGDYAAVPPATLPDKLTEKGFNNIFYISWHSMLDNTVNLPILAARTHSMGHVLAWWNCVRPDLVYYRGLPTNAYASVALSASYSWKPSQEHNYWNYHYDPIQVFRALFDPEKISEVQKTDRATPIPMGQAINTRLGDTLLFPQFTPKQLSELQAELALLPGKYQLICKDNAYYALAISGNPQDNFAKSPVSLKVGTKAKMLSFLMTGTLWNDMMMRTVPVGWGASFTVKYTDGTSEADKLCAGDNLIPWNIYPTAYNAQALVRGKDKNGAIYTFGAFHWENPHPEKQIAEVVFAPTQQTNTSTVVLAVSAVNAAEKKLPAVQMPDLNKVQAATSYRDFKVTPIIDFSNGMPEKLTHTDNQDVFEDKIEYNFVEDKKGNYLEIKLPPVKKGRGNGRVYVRYPISNPNYKTIVLDREISSPEDVSRSDLYYAHDRKSHSFLSYDKRTPLTTLRNTVYFPVDKPNELEYGGADLSNPNLQLLLAFSVVNRKPMTIRIYGVGYSMQSVFNVSRKLQ